MGELHAFSRCHPRVLSPRRRAVGRLSVNLEAEYKRLFGATRVLMEPIADHHLCSGQALRANILPFLRTADRQRASGDPLLGLQWPNAAKEQNIAN